MTKRINFILDEIRYYIRQAIDINKMEAALLDILNRTEDQEERESLIHHIDTINADMFDYIDEIDGYIADLEEALGGDDEA